MTTQIDEQDWQDCGLPMHLYKFTKLPRADENAHKDFKPLKYKNSQSNRGKSKKLTDEERTIEAQKMLQAQEEKAMSYVEEPVEILD